MNWELFKGWNPIAVLGMGLIAYALYCILANISTRQSN